jgi:hypothetical protein
MSRNLVVTGLVAGVLLIAGCGKDGTPSASGSSPAQDKSPLSEYMGSDFTSSGGGGFRVAIGGSDEQPTEEQLANRRKVEDAIAKCMKDQGFSYVPVPPEAEQKDKFADVFRLPPDKFAEQYGYGISTIDFSEGESDDPNTKIRDALSERAKAAYDKALNGQRQQQSSGSGGAKVEGGPGIGGCRAKAIDEVYGAGTAAKKGEAGAQEMRRFESLFRDLDTLRERIQDDPKVAAAARTWSDCMADARQTGLKKPEEAREKVMQRFNQLLGIQPGERKKAIGPDSLKNLDPAKLAEIRKYELAVAKADYDCRQKGYDTVYKEVQYAAEREFIQDHKTILEQFKDSMAEGPR